MVLNLNDSDVFRFDYAFACFGKINKTVLFEVVWYRCSFVYN